MVKRSDDIHGYAGGDAIVLRATAQVHLVLEALPTAFLQSTAISATAAGAVVSHPASVVRPDASSLPASAAWAAGAVAAAAQADLSWDGSARADYSAVLTVDGQSGPAALLDGLARAGYLERADLSWDG